MRKPNQLTAGMATVALSLVAVIGWQLGRDAHHARQHRFAASSDVSLLRTAQTPAPTAASGALRPVYGHALVRGGVRSVAELAALLHTDPQLAKHFQGFDLSKAHIITLDHDVVAYVSYRLDKGIYWSSRPILIRSGEEVITDGANFIRAACANQIAYAPNTPTNPEEPDDVGIVVALIASPPAPPQVEPPDASTDETVPPASELPAAGGLFVAQGSELDIVAVPPPIVVLPSAPPPPHQFSADQFPALSATVFQHAVKLPTTLITLFAGVLLVLVLHFSLGRMG